MADTNNTYQSRGIATDCVRRFMAMSGHVLKCQVEADLICAIEDMLDEEIGDELADETERADVLEEEHAKVVDNAAALASWLRQVLDLVKRDPLGSTVECPCCSMPLENGDHYECDLARLLLRDEIGG